MSWVIRRKPRRHDGAAFYARHIAPFVERHGASNAPVRLAVWPPAREAAYYELADRRRALRQGEPGVADVDWLASPAESMPQLARAA